MAYSGIDSLWGLFNTEEGRSILLEQGRKNPRLLVKKLLNLSAVNREARVYVDQFTRNPKVRNIFYTVFNAEHTRIEDELEAARGPDKKKPIEAYEIFLKDLLKLKAGLVGFANAYGGRFQHLLENLNNSIEMTQYHVYKTRAESGSKPDELRLELIKFSHDLDWDNEHLDGLKEHLRGFRSDPPQQLLRDIEFAQNQVDDIKRQMASIQREIDGLESEGGGGGTAEDGGDILNEVDGNFIGCSTRVV